MQAPESLGHRKDESEIQHLLNIIIIYNLRED